MRETIGKRIENEVRKQEWDITKFADAICCKRNNVYNIFKRNNMDIQLLARISKVLKHNYFKDLSDDPELVDLSMRESEKDKSEVKAVSQFFEIMPDVLTRIGMRNCVTFNKNEMVGENSVAFPDIILPGYLVCFTIGMRWIDKANILKNPLFAVQTLMSPDNVPIDIVENTLFGSVFIDIELDYKSEKLWENTMIFVKDNCLQYARLPKRL
jgi:hypothetical protein